VDTPITIVEMCAGYGGIGLGLRRIFGEKLRTIAYSEIEASPCELLLTRMEEGQLEPAPIWTDLKSFPWQDFNGLVSILVAGYPCQPFSSAGARKGKDDPRHLFPYILEGVKSMRPTLCLFENVEGHITLGLSSVISSLEEIGYECSFCVCSASEVGAPHQRKRIFLMAYDSSQRVQGHWASWLQESYTYARKTLSLCGGETRDAFPARPKQPQHWWEPPRVVGNPKHNGLSSTKIDGGSVSTSNDLSEGTELPCESSGASKSNCDKDIPECEERVVNTLLPSGIDVSREECSSTEQLELGNPSSMGNTEGGVSGVSQGGNWWESPRAGSQTGGEYEQLAYSENSRCGGGSNQDGDNREGFSLNSGEVEPVLRSETSGCCGDSRGKQVGDSECGGWESGDGNWTQAEESGTGCEHGSGLSPRPEAESEICGSVDGTPDWMGYVNLCQTYNDRISELKMLGNGVCPAQAERAFLLLISELGQRYASC